MIFWKNIGHKFTNYPVNLLQILQVLGRPRIQRLRHEIRLVHDGEHALRNRGAEGVCTHEGERGHKSGPSVSKILWGERGHEQG